MTGERYLTPQIAEAFEERRRAGKHARTRVGRQALGDWDPDATRRDPLDCLVAQESIRAHDLLPLRYGRMVQSPWTFYRGAAAVMAADLATQPHSGLEVQLCGDAHILNFGLWATPERHLAFDLRDFDETLPGPFEWDVKRLAASIVVLARDDGLAQHAADAAVRSAVTAYRDRIAQYANEGELEIWYDRIDVEQLLGHFGEATRAQVAAVIDRKAKHRSQQAAFDKLTTAMDGTYRIAEQPPKLTHIDVAGNMNIVNEVFERYSETLQDDRRELFDKFDLLDIARHVPGVGSVGMRVHLLLLMGRNGFDPLFLQVKQAGPSVYEQFIGASRYDNHGARVVNGMRLIQSATDIFVGWTRYRDRDYYVRQFRDMKIIADSNGIAPVLGEFAAACGDALAKAHARSGDPVAIAAYIGKSDTFGESMLAFGQRYADQTERDHGQLEAAARQGRITAAADTGAE